MKRVLIGLTIVLGVVMPLNAANRVPSSDPPKDSTVGEPESIAAPGPTTPMTCADVPLKSDGSVDMVAYGEKVGKTTPAPRPMGSTPDCPTVVHCPPAAGCQRCHGVNCGDVDTGEANCMLTPNVEFHCSSGTIHIHPCNMCEGLCTVGHECTDAYSQTWDCE